MACATLKRSLEWEPMLGARPVKRRRCVPFSASPSNFQERDLIESVDVNTSPKTESVFPVVLSHKLTPEYMAESIKAEIRRLHRRRQLQFSGSAMENSSDAGGSGGEQLEIPPHLKDCPLFTFKEVGQICERLLLDRETEIRQEYDNVLTAKLSEQHEAFVKFTYDQIQRNYHYSAPSYLS